MCCLGTSLQYSRKYFPMLFQGQFLDTYRGFFDYFKYPYQIIIEALQQAMQQFTWTLGNLKYNLALLSKHLRNNLPVHPLDTSDEYFSKTTLSMRYLAITAL